MYEYVDEQKELMEQIFKETKENEEQLNALLINETNIDKNIYGFSEIEKNHKILVEKYSNFSQDIKNIQKHKYNFQIASLILFIIITIAGISGYWLRRQYIPWIASLLILIFCCPVVIISGIETSNLFLSIDFCGAIGNSIISGIIPSDNRGLGTYLSCPSKDTLRIISTELYQYITNFNFLYNQTQSILKSKDWLIFYKLGEAKRNNSHFDFLYNLIKEVEIPSYEKDINDAQEKKNIILRNLKSFGIINVIMAELLSMSSCYTSKNSINFIEENYCLVNHSFMSKNIIFNLISCIGFICVAIGMNKLTLVIKSVYAKAKRGKKEFNNDIIKNDNEEDDIQNNTKDKII